ncbi:hypothetical protein D4764_08G0001550 [Takifugu flavidus]|uniref:Uncharacterized protein n=1 Tax=Takifugu flavidus TaxID=433684 RepID=A0A5C6MNM5_9TELE|nr:hypothetical protein D4764_08G0001550 [Takifugu flavidus]
MFGNDRWCNPGHIRVKEQYCSKDIELIAVSIRPYYLPREFSHVIAITVYIPPSADAAAACETVHTVVSKLQTSHPQSLLFISVNTKDAYTSSPLPPLGRSDHNLVHLSPAYIPMVNKQPPTKRLGCVDIDGLTTCITDYINFCVENTVATRKVWCFPNNKPWVTPDLKALLNEKKRVFKSGDKEELRRVQKELRRGIRRGKDSYRRKLEEHLKGSNAREVWRGLKTISGHTKDSGRGPESGDLDWANKLNSFFNRFDCAAPASPTHQSPDLTVLSHHHPPSPPVTPPAPAALSHHATSLHPLPDRPSHSNSPDQVRKELRRTKTRKATGPDGINSRLLKNCADQLCGILLHIFNLSLSLERVPLLWKTSCVVPVPKTAHAREPNHFRPVALTSHRMKTMERIVLTHLRQLVEARWTLYSLHIDQAVVWMTLSSTCCTSHSHT